MLKDFHKAWEGYFIEDERGGIRPPIALQVPELVIRHKVKCGWQLTFTTLAPDGNNCLLSVFVKGGETHRLDIRPHTWIKIVGFKKPVQGDSGEWFRPAIIETDKTDNGVCNDEPIASIR